MDNINEDIKVLEKLSKNNYYGDVTFTREAEAIENLLKAYKQDEEVIDEMAYVMSKTIRISGVRQHKKFFKEYFRKKVTNE